MAVTARHSPIGLHPFDGGEHETLINIPITLCDSAGFGGAYSPLAPRLRLVPRRCMRLPEVPLHYSLAITLKLAV